MFAIETFRSPSPLKVGSHPGEGWAAAGVEPMPVG